MSCGFITLSVCPTIQTTSTPRRHYVVYTTTSRVRGVDMNSAQKRWRSLVTRSVIWVGNHPLDSALFLALAVILLLYIVPSTQFWVR